MIVSWTRTTDPQIEPIDIATAKLQCRVDHRVEDSWFADQIAAARGAAEEYLHRGLLTQSWKLVLDDWATAIWLPMAAPLQGTPIIKYYDQSGTLQTVASTQYIVDAVSEPARIVLAPSSVWPAHQVRRAAAVEITYDVGWTSPDKVYRSIVLGMLMAIGTWYVDREKTGDIPPGSYALWAPHRVFWREPEC